MRRFSEVSKKEKNPPLPSSFSENVTLNEDIFFWPIGFSNKKCG